MEIKSVYKKKSYFVKSNTSTDNVADDNKPILNKNFLWLYKNLASLTVCNFQILAPYTNITIRIQSKYYEKNSTLKLQNPEYFVYLPYD